MKIILLILLHITFISGALAQSIDVAFKDNQIKQGALVSAKITLDAESFQKIQAGQLRGQTLAETLYIHSLSSFMRRQGDNLFDADAVVVLAKVPEARTISAEVAGTKVTISLGDIHVVATETDQRFLFSDFTVKEPIRILKWVLGALVLIALVVLGIFIYRKQKKKILLKKKIREMRNLLVEASKYDEVVSIWERKQEFFALFPQIQESFLTFQEIFFKYQFKRVKTEFDKAEIVKAYRDFVSKVSGGLDGI